MAITLVKKATTFDTAGTGSTIAGTFASFVRPGDLIILALNSYTGTVTGITDTQSNTYTPIGTVVNGNDYSYLYYVQNANGGSVVTTVTMNSSHSKSLGLYEYSGFGTSGVLDQTVKGTATSGTIVSPGALTPTNNNSLIISLGGDYVSGGNGTVQANNSFTLQSEQDSTTGERYYYEDLVQGAKAAGTASFTIGSSASWRAIAASFNPSTNAAISTLSDTFGDGSINTTLWGTYTGNSSTLSESGTTLNETPAPNTTSSWTGVYSKSVYDLTGGTAFVQQVNVGSAYTFFDLTLSRQPIPINNDFISIGVDTGLNQMQAGDEINGAFVVRGSITFNPATMKWVRIRENTGTLYYEYAAGANGPWTAVDSRVPAISINSLYVVLDDFEYNTTGTPGLAQFNNFNLSDVNFGTMTGAFSFAGTLKQG